ncbi:g8578 [Coccomyxa elongata]
MQKKRSESVHLCEAGCGFERQILKESGGAMSAGTANPLTAQVIQKHLADISEPHNPDILRIDENLAG